VFVSVFFRGPQLGKITYVFRLLGLGLIFLGVSSAFYVHSLFPKRHERPTDFSKLLKEGPYRYVRHPFYSSLILISFGMAIFCESILGLAAALLLILLWEKLAEVEERELLERWGEEYREFMKSRGRFFLKLAQIFRRKGSKWG